MIDLKNQKWNLSETDKSAIKWFKRRQYNLILKEQYINKTVFIISKNEISKEIEIYQNFDKSSLSRYLQLFVKDLENIN